MAFLIILGLFCVIVLRVYRVYTEQKLIKSVTPITRGERAERKLILSLIKAGINPRAIFHDLYIKKPSGEYAQIDVAVATRTGIIIFEVKDFSGWIFGNQNQKYWTQLLAYGKEKHRFYNPIMQNASHIRTIRHYLLQNPRIPIYSVIVFFGKCELKNVTYNEPNTFIIYPHSLSKLISNILNQPEAQFGNKYEIMNVLTQAVENGNDPRIVSFHKDSATYYGRNKPNVTYKRSFPTLFRFRWRRKRRFRRRRRFL